MIGWWLVWPTVVGCVWLFTFAMCRTAALADREMEEESE